MSFVGRYWEWRRWRAFEASLRVSEHARELALVADILMDRRGISRRPGDGEQALPVGEAAAAPADPDGVPLETAGESADVPRRRSLPTATLPAGRRSWRL